MFESRISAGVTQIQGVRLALDPLNFEPFFPCVLGIQILFFLGTPV